MHRQTGLAVFLGFFLVSQSSESLYNDSHTARALMMNRMLFWMSCQSSVKVLLIQLDCLMKLMK